MNPALPRVLSIQSHVVHGYVGNKAAVLPLQLNGYDVDAINTVQFSNHTGYAAVKGTVLTGEANNLVSHSHVLTGYIGSLSVLQTIQRVVEAVRHANPDAVYVCDPVLGDEGKMYAKPELLDGFRDILTPLASVLTPNQYEAELLTGIHIHSVQDALRALDVLHARGPALVVITSMQDPHHPDHVTVIASRAPTDTTAAQRVRLDIPRLEGYFTGSGDLFAALLLVWLARHPQSLAHALEGAVAVLQAVLQDTAAAAAGMVGKERTAEVWGARELRLVHNIEALQGGVEVVYRAQPVGE